MGLVGQPADVPALVRAIGDAAGGEYYRHASRRVNAWRHRRQHLFEVVDEAFVPVG